LDSSESVREIHGKFRNVVPEEAGDQFGLSCEICRSITKSQGWMKYPT